ncbi:hypothetical protein BDZ85DRAFT_271708 [Elsinoe ampelina]|uniref:SAC3/GANP/Nin1/mts3/eIF-3 p25 family-domain-containing protein n=1 Tax=Elsinoe ampelina TaxID=302913 RepID=A0A6A6GKY2_9PEZI|nr:hypothetical protein BDZ85DRAFT_271708 [Elsinoe ampelina]
MNVAASRPATKRLTSGGWGRLRAPQIDPLEAYGLPSKGETRLNDHKAQEAYYRKIVDRYMRFCAASGSGDALETAFRSLSVSEPLDLRSQSRSASQASSRTSTPTPQVDAQQPPHPKPKPLSDSKYTEVPPAPIPRPTSLPTPPTTLSHPQQTELSLLLSSMRKLRESLTATARTDPFAQRVYIFILRATLLMQQWESYLPCLTHLLHRIHPVTPLGASELREVVSWWILDLACRQGKLREAQELREEWMGLAKGKGRGKGVQRDRDVDAILRALVRDDWITWRRVKGRVDGYVRALMEMGEEAVRVNVLKVVGRAYLRIEREVLERWTGKEWEGLVGEGVGWELEGEGQGDGEWVVVRRIKGKST